MAIVEHKPEASDPKPLILGVSLLVIIVLGVGGVLYWMLRSPKPKQIVLNEEQAKQAAQSDPGAPAVPGPAFPAAPPVEQIKDPGPTMVTLDLKNVTVPEAIAALSKQSGVSLQSPNRGGPQGFMAMLTAKRINLAVSNQPFWVAMRELCRQAELNTHAQWNQKRDEITVQPGRQGNLDNPSFPNGSTLLVLNNVTSRFDADLLVNRPAPRSLDVHMTLYVEPKLNAYRISPVAKVETAVDEKGTSLIRPPQQYDDRNHGGARQLDQRRPLHPQLPPSAGQKIAKLSGYIPIVVAGKEEILKIKDPLSQRNQDHKVENTLIRVVRVNKQGDNAYQATLQVDNNSPVFKDFESASRIAKLVDTNGKEFQRGGGGWGGGPRNAFEFSVYFYAPGGGMSQPAELQIAIPTGIKEIRVPFSFTDLPLPH